MAVQQVKARGNNDRGAGHDAAAGTTRQTTQSMHAPQTMDRYS